MRSAVAQALQRAAHGRNTNPINLLNFGFLRATNMVGVLSAISPDVEPPNTANTDPRRRALRCRRESRNGWKSESAVSINDQVGGACPPRRTAYNPHFRTTKSTRENYYMSRTDLFKV